MQNSMLLSLVLFIPPLLFPSFAQAVGIEYCNVSVTSMEKKAAFVGIASAFGLARTVRISPVGLK